MRERVTPLLAPQQAAIAKTSKHNSLRCRLLAPCADWVYSAIQRVVVRRASTNAARSWHCNSAIDLNVHNHVHCVVVPFVQFIGGKSLQLPTVIFASYSVEVPVPGTMGASGRATTRPIESGPLQERHAMVKRNVLPRESFDGMWR